MKIIMISLDFIRIFLLTCCLLPTISGRTVKRATDSPVTNKRIACYYTNWSPYRQDIAKFSPKKIDVNLCTHLLYAFAVPDLDEGIKSFDPNQDLTNNGYEEFANLKMENKDLKVMISVGGWNEGSIRFSEISATEEKRQSFVNKTIVFLKKYNFDGIDLVWQYPTFRDGGKPEDKVNYGLLTKSLQEAFDIEAQRTGEARYILSMAVPGIIDYIDLGYDVPNIDKYLDFYSVLGYDLHVSFEPFVHHHAPLYPLKDEIDTNSNIHLNADWAINKYLSKGGSPDKLNLGIPTYARSFTLNELSETDIGSPAEGPGDAGKYTGEKGYLAYYELCNVLKEDGWTVEHKNSTAMGPYAYKDDQWVVYDDTAMVQRKAQYAIDKRLGGLTFWALAEDDFPGICNGRKNLIVRSGRDYFMDEKNYGNNNNKNLNINDDNNINNNNNNDNNNNNNNNNDNNDNNNNNNNNNKPVISPVTENDDPEALNLGESVQVDSVVQMPRPMSKAILKLNKDLTGSSRTNEQKELNKIQDTPDTGITWLKVVGGEHLNVFQNISVVYNNNYYHHKKQSSELNRK